MNNEKVSLRSVAISLILVVIVFTLVFFFTPLGGSEPSDKMLTLFSLIITIAFGVSAIAGVFGYDTLKIRFEKMTNNEIEKMNKKFHAEIRKLKKEINILKGSYLISSGQLPKTSLGTKTGIKNRK